jgi:hypothetical protein
VIQTKGQNSVNTVLQMFNMEDNRDAGFALIVIEIRSKREITRERNTTIPVYALPL